ncbi:hypothetical protein TBLA_0A01390 [Henningerozyma blattae CBS 6284]|uniref:SP-RING-type domain-containing protein n=1 Tax=Henningerozyma blattae (strain ATCC 34711 / CBS 6284 / DSM 70876 / NBRC 10599 / NRRL Y-10934 / UCD 77-7) TaxID=1071380 RepID=I2GUY6_HENB6|nr:hypothetical protein TBLA_0A01390 [Tetrapisispora blattae CBS 6284]CCH57938.1 hypothetical protein TBLA_0A01390 [Tetrapisispora blattae CBS 6284]
MSQNAVPTTLPIHKNSIRNFHELRPQDISKDFNTIIENLYDTLLLILDNAIVMGDNSSIDELVENLSSQYQEVINSINLNLQKKNITKNILQEYKTLSDACPQISLDNWDDYRTGNLTAPSLFEMVEKSFKTVIENPIPIEEKSSKAKILKYVSQIWKDPHCVITSDNTTEDDLMIEGGRIELTCPITVKVFEHPMISNVCHHTFDKSGLVDYFKGYRTRECPESACSQHLQFSDFKFDDVMSLRCKIAAIKKNALNNDDTDIDSL